MVECVIALLEKNIVKRDTLNKSFKELKEGFFLKETNAQLKVKTLSGLIWMFAERVGAQLVSFIVSIVLARLLLPEDYGTISLVTIFITICNVFVSAGFGNALIQKKEADELDFSSVFYCSFIVSLFLYVVMFFGAPVLAEFYGIKVLIPVVRVMGIRIIIASFNSVQRAYVSRNLEFKKFFWSTIIGTVISAFVGIAMAYKGYGVWALVGQYLSNTVIDTIILFITVKWYPKIMFSFSRMKVLVSYGWKVLVTGLIDALYEDFRSLYIGKLYSTQDLAYYTRGRQFPSLIVNNVNSSIMSVLFPVMSKKQDNRKDIKAMTRRSIKISSYVMMPVMFGLASVAEPLVRFLLTDKWLPCVPFLQILCFNSALTPIQSSNVQAIYAMGRSDIVLRLNIIKKITGFIIVLISAQISVIAMAYGGILTGIVCSIVNAYPNKKLMDYGYWEQIRDILPYVAMSSVMSILVWLIAFIDMSAIVTLVLQIVAGVCAYICLSKLFKVDSYNYIINIAASMLKKIRKQG